MAVAHVVADEKFSRYLLFVRATLSAAVVVVVVVNVVVSVVVVVVAGGKNTWR